MANVQLQDKITNIDVIAPAKTVVKQWTKQVASPLPPNYQRHVLADIDLKEIWQYNLMSEAKQLCLGGGMRVSAVYRFCAASRDGQFLRLYDRPGAFPLATLRLAPAQADAVSCLTSCVAIYIVNVSIDQSNLLQRDKNITALTRDTANAAATWLLEQIRLTWGLNHSGKYTRFNSLDQNMQKTLFSILRPADIGVNLTKEGTMDSVAAISALVLPGGVLYTSQ